jgi:enediyne biosynthesis protein E7
VAPEAFGHPLPPRDAHLSRPGPRGLRLLGSLFDVRRDPLGFALGMTRRYGDVVEFRIGRRRLFLFNHPEAFRAVLRDNPERYAKGIGLTEARPLLGDGLLTGDGPAWAARRQQLHALFQPDRLEHFAAAVAAATGDWIERRRETSGTGEALDFAEEMTGLTLDILGRTLLRVDLRAAAALADDFDGVQRWAIRRMTSPWAPSLAWPTPANRRVSRALARFDGTVESWVAARRAAAPADTAAEPDALDLLLAGPAEPTARELRDEILTLLLAGHETGSAALGWTAYLLARHPATGERLAAESDEVLGGRAPVLADLQRLPYAKAVLQESMRLFPPVWMLPRRAKEDGEVAGVPVPAGADVLLCPYALHRHPQFWEDPEEFRPERFTAGRAPAAGAYLPFGHGPRACLGSGFAMMETTLVLALLAGRFRFRLAAGAAPVPEPLLSLKPRRLLLTLHRAG